MSIPKQQRALVLEEKGKFAVKTVPTPTPDALPAGAAIVRVISSILSPTARAILSGYGPPIPDTPYVSGQSCIGRVVALGPDATTLQKDDLVYVDTFLRPRDDPTNTGAYLWGYFQVDARGKALGNGVWRDSSNTEYAAAPLENIYKLDEQILCSTLGYTPDDLSYLQRMLVGFGGLTEIGLQPGETIAIAPATGAFGGAAIHVALAMGAHVIAAARTQAALDRVLQTHGHTGRVSIALLTGSDAEADAQALARAAPRHGVIDAYLDFVPSMSQNTTYLKSGLLALRPRGRACIMGGSTTDVAIPYAPVFMRNLRIYGKMMYEREDVARLIRLVESGHLKLGPKAGLQTAGFKLEQFEEAYSAAEGGSPGLQNQVVFNP